MAPMEKRAVILFHPGGGGSLAFDVLVPEGFDDSDIKAVLETTGIALYRVECPYAKRFLRENPGYRYIGSEDMDHIPEINVRVSELVTRLEAAGFEDVYEGQNSKSHLSAVSVVRRKK